MLYRTEINITKSVNSLQAKSALTTAIFFVNKVLLVYVLSMAAFHYNGRTEYTIDTIW